MGIPTMFEDNKYYYSDRGKAELLCAYFTSQCTLPYMIQSDSLPPLIYKTNERLDSVEISKHIARSIFSKVKINKANGPDNVSNHLLKSCSESLAKPLSKLFSVCLNKGESD